MIHLLFIPQGEAHTVLVSGLAVEVGERMGNQAGALEKILRKLKAFLGNGFKRLSLAGTDLGAPPEIPRYTGLFVCFLSFRRGEEGLDIKHSHSYA